MKACEQAPGWTIYQHGMDIGNRYRDLYEHLNGAKPRYRWSLGGCDPELKELLPFVDAPAKARAYHIFHDCGKPRCLTIDEEGKRHFPNHARISAERYREAMPDDERTAELIEMDMLCHTLKGDELSALARHQLAPTLLLTAWAELHSNAEVLFGGFESTSFKIKRKQLLKATARIIEALR